MGQVEGSRNPTREGSADAAMRKVTRLEPDTVIPAKAGILSSTAGWLRCGGTCGGRWTSDAPGRRTLNGPQTRGKGSAVVSGPDRAVRKDY